MAGIRIGSDPRFKINSIAGIRIGSDPRFNLNSIAGIRIGSDPRFKLNSIAFKAKLPGRRVSVISYLRTPGFKIPSQVQNYRVLMRPLVRGGLAMIFPKG